MEANRIEQFFFSFEFREHLIDKNIESAVSRMQSVIELGRVIRDRKTIPVKVRCSLLSFTSISHKHILVFSDNGISKSIKTRKWTTRKDFRWPRLYFAVAFDFLFSSLKLLVFISVSPKRGGGYPSRFSGTG